MASFESLKFEIYKHRMGRIVSLKEQVIEKLIIKISNCEKELKRPSLILKWFEKYLRQLKLDLFVDF